MFPLLPPLKPIAIKERLSVVFVERGHLDVLDGAFVAVDRTGVRTHLPVGGVACLMLEPGTRVSHADRLLYKARLALDENLCLKVVHKMYALRFGEEPPARRSVDQLRGIGGARVRRTYQLLAQQYGVEWKARNYDTSEWDKGDLPNRCLSCSPRPWG